MLGFGLGVLAVYYAMVGCDFEILHHPVEYLRVLACGFVHLFDKIVEAELDVWPRVVIKYWRSLSIDWNIFTAEGCSDGVLSACSRFVFFGTEFDRSLLSVMHVQ